MCNPHQIFDDQIKDDEMRGTSDTYEEGEQCVQIFLWQNLKERGHLEKLDQ
jgi:hypothetical protein